MKRLRGLLRLILLLPLLIPAQSFAALETSANVIIVELQTTGLNNNTSEEFVEIYNAGERPVDVSSWKLQYSSASGTSWQNKVVLNGILQPKSKLLLSSADYLTDITDISFTPGFKLEAGHVRLVSPDPGDSNMMIVEDLVGWGTAVFPETLAADFAPAGSSLERIKDESGEYIDTDNNRLDFSIAVSPTPESTNTVVTEEQIDSLPLQEGEELSSEDSTEVVAETVNVEEPQEQVDQEEIVESVTEQRSGFVVEIRELMPNPAPPLSDSADEFIELYNPNNFPVDLSGYKLQSGNSFSYSYEFDQKILGPDSYLTLYITETGLILSNASGKARLLDPSGNVISETDAYSEAKEGQAWAWVNGAWQWTVQPTPGVSNTFAPPLLAGIKTTSPKPKTQKKVAAKKSTAGKKTAAKKTTKKPKKEKKAQVAGVATESDDSNGGSSINPVVIAAVGTLALGYAVYEYKDDVANKLRQFRSNRELRRKTRRPV